MSTHLQPRLTTRFPHVCAVVYSDPVVTTSRPFPRRTLRTGSVPKLRLRPDLAEFIGALALAFRHQIAFESP
jgi:hypothetical protein